jgi:hypothetical protein
VLNRQQHKFQLRYNPDQKMRFPIPKSEDFNRFYGNKNFDKFIKGGEGREKILEIPYNDIRDKVFEPTIQRIIHLMDKQIEDALRYTKSIDAIILVGGFGSSKYLKARLKKTYKNIKVKAPKNGLNVISQGAVSYGLNPRLVSRITLDDEVKSDEESNSIRLPSSPIDSADKSTVKESEKVDFIVGLGK